MDVDFLKCVWLQFSVQWEDGISNGSLSEAEEKASVHELRKVEIFYI